MDKFKQLKKILGEDLKEHIVLRDYSTMKVGGVADYFYIAKDINSLIQAISVAKNLKIPFEVLGGASNVIISDFGFPGLVILNRSNNIAFLQEQAQIIVDSGVSLARLVAESASRNLGGLEYFYGIPGTIGGAIYGNAGCQGIEICSMVKGVTLLSPEGKIVHYRGDWLKPLYRSTILKKLRNDGRPIPIILSAKLQLQHSRKEEMLEKISEYKQKREKSQPYNFPSAGSIFKNPKSVASSDGKPMSAGYLIDECGLKGIKVGDAVVSKIHANFIVNRGKAQAIDIRSLINLVKDKVKELKDADLVEEVEYIGRWE